MIGKVKVGKSFAGICRYVFGEDKQAQVLAAEGVRTNSAAHMAQDFEYQQRQRPGLGKAVLHVALALPAEDAQGRSAEQVSALLREAGRAYVQAMKLDNTQWALVQHFDKAHPHAHLVVNRVDNDGQTIADNFIGQQSRRVCQGLEQQLGLTVAEQQGRVQVREVAPTPRQATATTAKQARTADWQRARHEVANALKHTAPYVGSWEELQTKLTRHDIQVKPSEHRKADGPAQYGVVFEKNGHRFKGSEVGKAYSASKLQVTFAQHAVLAPVLLAQAEQAARAYAGQGLNQRFAEQARQAQQQAQAAAEVARQARERAARQPSVRPDRGQGLGF